MTESTKLTRLRELREKLAAGRFKPDELKKLRIVDTDGAQVRMDAPEALAALDRRIAAEESGDAQ